MDINEILNDLYASDPKAQSLEKTAEAEFSLGLQNQHQVAHNPYDDMSLEELAKLAQEADIEVGDEADPNLEKVAFEKLLGEVMAHAMVHEFGEIKVATVNSACRICKETTLQPGTGTVCAECTGG